MSLPSFLQAYPAFFITLCGIIGLLVGSFLNVLIYRLPIMMQRNWKKECSEFLELDTSGEKENTTFNLFLPHSHCPKCNTEIRAYQNIPILSYLFLKGQCAYCKEHIPLRYPMIEAITGTTSAIVALHYGYGPAAFFAILLTWSLIALSAIDFDHHLLPDSITLPMLWLGLLLSLFTIFSDAHASIIGAIAGYLSLWSVYHLFKLATGKEGMGFGDFKLLAMLGAWLGWQYLPIIIVLSSLVGAVVGIMMIIIIKRDHNIPIPFGPYLATAGWLAMLWGNDINQLYLNSTGL